MRGRRRLSPAPLLRGVRRTGARFPVPHARPSCPTLEIVEVRRGWTADLNHDGTSCSYDHGHSDHQCAIDYDASSGDQRPLRLPAAPVLQCQLLMQRQERERWLWLWRKSGTSGLFSKGDKSG